MSRRHPPDQSIWVAPERGKRGPSLGLDRDVIVDYALAIADAEGVGAVSMRRVADELGVGAASLYRYVRTKDELIELMTDHAFARSTPRPTGVFRDDATAFARLMRAELHRHPWLVAGSSQRPSLGPNGLRWIEASLAVFDPLPLHVDTLHDAVATLTTFVRGFVADEIAERVAAAETSLDAWRAAQAARGSPALRSDAFPRTARVMREARGPHDPKRSPRAFAFGLNVVLDGLERAFERPGALTSGRGERS